MDLKQDLRCDTIDTREEYELKVRPQWDFGVEKGQEDPKIFGGQRAEKSKKFRKKIRVGNAKKNGQHSGISGVGIAGVVGGKFGNLGLGWDEIQGMDGDVPGGDLGWILGKIRE